MIRNVQQFSRWTGLKTLMPEKKVFWMENASHGTLEEDPDHFNRIMNEMILTKHKISGHNMRSYLMPLLLQVRQ